MDKVIPTIILAEITSTDLIPYLTVFGVGGVLTLLLQWIRDSRKNKVALAGAQNKNDFDLAKEWIALMAEFSKLKMQFLAAAEEHSKERIEKDRMVAELQDANKECAEQVTELTVDNARLQAESKASDIVAMAAKVAADVVLTAADAKELLNNQPVLVEVTKLPSTDKDN